MANTIAGINVAAIAEQSLPGLQSLFAPLAGIHTDFSNDIQMQGGSVTTRYPTKPTAADLSGGYTAAAADVAMTAKTITLSNFQGFVWGFTDAERSKDSGILNSLFIEPALQAVGAKVFGDLWNLVVNANFATSSTITAANFGRDDLIDIGVTLTNTKKAPKTGRFAICSPSYYANLLKELNAAEFPGIDENKAEGLMPRCAGFNIYETDLADDNSENLGAFVGQRSSLLMAARSVDTQGAEAAGVEIADVVVPGLGLPVQFRKWYSADDGKLYFSMGVLYGVQTGVDFGVRVTSA